MLHHSVDILRAGVAILGPRDEVVYANPSATRLGLIADETGTPTLSQTLSALVARVRRSGLAKDVELKLSRPGDDPLGVRVRIAPLADSFIAVEVEDMTEAYQVARVRRDFVANVSHELKTPVGALRLLSEALLDATDDPQTAHRFAERIRHETARLGRLVDELLELSRLEGGEPLPNPELMPVDRIVTEVLDRCRTTASAKGISIDVQGSLGLKVHGTERLLVTALANLVDNAIAYSPANTTVTISTRLHDDHVEISVTDQGIGIAPEDQSRIFERFYRADPARSRATGGTGLGLAIVKHIATSHGGGVSVVSEPGHGSTFTLRLPAGPPSVKRPTRRATELVKEDTTRGTGPATTL